MTGTQRFVKERQPNWQRMEEILKQVASQGLKSLDEDGLLELAHRYRQATSDLAHAQAFIRDARVLEYLNDLVGRAHAVVYRTPPTSLRGLWSFVSLGFPALVWKRARFIIAAALLFFGSGFFGYGVVKWDFYARAAVVPANMADLEETLSDKKRWAEVDPETAPFVSTQIFLNNIRVALLAFASGVFLGVGTVLVLLFNGVFLGAVVGLAEHYGSLEVLLAFVVSHGVIELTCICIAGGAGLLLGSAFVAPGERTVRDAVVERGREAVMLMLGTVPLLVLAGLVEGFVSPLDVPHTVQFVFAILPAAFLVWYLARGRHRTGLHPAL